LHVSFPNLQLARLMQNVLYACPPACEQTAPLFECLVHHPEYYGPQLDSMKQQDAQPAAKEQQQQQATAKAAGSSSVGQQAAAAAAAAGTAGELSAAAV
jgi:hypothetical protein